MAPPPVLVLDLDGTIVDSLCDLGAALNRLLVARGLPPLALEDIKPMVGDGSAKLLERALAARGACAHAGDLDRFVADYTAHAAIETRPYPGVTATLRSLAEAGWRFAICTNKPAAATAAVLAAFDLTAWFAFVGGGDSFAAKKPDPWPLLGTIAAAGGTRERAAMVGDHANDIAAARAVQIPSIFAAWGYGSEVMAQGATMVARRFSEIAEIAPRLVP